MTGGLLVGPAMGLVGALVCARVTTKLWPSHPLVDNRSIHTVREALDNWESAHTVGTPRLVFVLDDYLSQSSGKAMIVIVHHGLSDMDCGLAHQVLKFLPSTVSGNLSVCSAYSPCFDQAGNLLPGGIRRIHHPISGVWNDVPVFGQETAWL